MKSVCLTLCIMMVGSIVIAQKKNAEAAAANFPDAMAVWLERKTDINLTWKNGEVKVEQQEHEEMLFTKDESANIAGKNTVYFSYFYQLKDWNAHTLLPDGRKIKVSNSTTHSRSSYIFFDDSKEIEFLYPAVVKGAKGITDVSYELKDPHLLTPFYFENYFPVASGILTITFPEEININYLVKGNKDLVQVKKETRRGKTTLTFEAGNVPGVNYYADAPPSSYFLTHVIFYIEKVKNASGVMEPFLGSVKDLARYYYSHIKDLEVNGGKEVEQVTDSLTRGLTDPVAKAKAIYKWVQQGVRYLAFEDGMGGFIPRNPELVCIRRYGDCKDKSSLLVSMLRHAGLKAHFTWIGSRQLPYAYSEVPLPVTDDHMICALELNGRFIFMDATDSYIPLEIPASHIQGKEAFIVMGPDQYKIERVPVPDAAYSVFSDSTFITMQDKILKGKIRIHTSGYETNDLMHNLEVRTGKAREEFLKSYCYRGNNKIVIKNMEVLIDTLLNTALINADFNLPDYAKYLGEEVFLNLNLSKPYVNREIDFPKRTIPIEFEFNSVMRHVVVLQIAEGYKVSSLPQVKDYQNDIWGVSVNCIQAGTNLYYTREFKNRFLYLYPETFQRWNKVLEHLFPTYKQSVVLSK